MTPIEKTGYLVHNINKKNNQALRFVLEMLDNCKSPYISLSFGKDSIPMADLILTNYPDTPVIYCYCGEFDEWPDTERVKRKFLDIHQNCNFHQVNGPSIIEFYKRLGYVYIQDLETNPEAAKIQREYGASLEKAVVSKARELGCDGAFIGMRKNESINRARLFAMRSEVYFTESRQMWTCCPIAQWSARDVWAYIVQKNLPWNELYDKHPEGREKARNGAMFGTRSDTFTGRLSMMRRMYPEWWNRFLQQFPEIAERT